jgi:hypothetical protein
MRVRVTGTRDETAAAVDALAEVLEVREVSGFYPNRSRSVLGRVYLSVLGRVYLDVAGVRPAVVRATADRADRPGRPGEVTARTP